MLDGVYWCFLFCGVDDAVCGDWGWVVDNFLVFCGIVGWFGGVFLMFGVGWLMYRRMGGGCCVGIFFYRLCMVVCLLLGLFVVGVLFRGCFFDGRSFSFCWIWSGHGGRYDGVMCTELWSVIVGCVNGGDCGGYVGLVIGRCWNFVVYVDGSCLWCVVGVGDVGFGVVDAGGRDLLGTLVDSVFVIYGCCVVVCGVYGSCGALCFLRVGVDRWIGYFYHGRGSWCGECGGVCFGRYGGLELGGVRLLDVIVWDPVESAGGW